MVLSLWLWSRTKLMATKNISQTLAILKAMWIRWCNAGRIAWRSASVASCGASRCRNGQVPALYCPGGPHFQRFLMKQKNTNKTQLLPSFLTVDRCKKARQFQDPTHTLYSRHQCEELRTNAKHDYSSWRAQLHFELSNVVNGQKFKKLLTLNEAQENLWAKYGRSG